MGYCKWIRSFWTYKYPSDSLGQNGGEPVAFTKYFDEDIGKILDFVKVMQYSFKCQNDYDST
jgi:hypothetical protein